jgi:hypothetical protein
MGVYPVPLIRETAFSSVGVCISPCGGAADRLVVLWFEEVREEACGTRSEECFGHEADLVVDWTSFNIHAQSLRLGRDSPSVFQHRAGTSHAVV